VIAFSQTKQITKISTALAIKVDWAEALFFFQLAVITGARMAELLRMRWEESDACRGTVKLYSSKTKKWRTIKARSAANLIANRKANNDGGITHVLTRRDHWFRKLCEKLPTVLAYSTVKSTRRMVPSRPATHLLNQLGFGRRTHKWN
jgi:integrase